MCGYDSVGQTLVRLLTVPPVQTHLEKSLDRPTRYIAFDLDPARVIEGFKDKKRILYGDGSQPMVLSTAGISSPSLFVITYRDAEQSLKAVERLRQAYPKVPIIARAGQMEEYFQLLEAGATTAFSDDREASFSLGTALLDRLGIAPAMVDKLKEEARIGLELEDVRTLNELEAKKGKGMEGTPAPTDEEVMRILHQPSVRKNVIELCYHSDV